MKAALLAAGLLALTACDAGRSPGERLYRAHCSECHGIDGAGNTPAYMGQQYADLTDSYWRDGGSDYALRKAIRDGVFGKMPGFRQLSSQEVDLLVEYVRSLRSGTAR